MILLRVGPNLESQERRKRRLTKLESGCDELIQTLGRLSIERKAVEDESAMDLM